MQQSYSDNAVARKLDNGMTITLERLPYLHSATAGLWVRSGSASESQSERRAVVWSLAQFPFLSPPHQLPSSSLAHLPHDLPGVFRA